MEGFEPSRRKSLLDHFSAIKDTRQSCKVMYRLEEVRHVVVSGSNCSCDDYDDIALWGQTHLEFLRKLAPFHWGLPRAERSGLRQNTR